MNNISRKIKKIANIIVASLNVDEYVKAIEQDIKGIFPKSRIKVEFTKNLTQDITIWFTLGNGKEEYLNGICHNDPFYNIISLHQLNHKEFPNDGTTPENLVMELVLGDKMIIPNVKGSEKIGFRKMTGTPEKVREGLKKYFMSMRKVYEANKDKLMDILKDK